ncbi:MAG: 2-C-methyl-D-erythritol 4-phosphate cytidylyltransferase [Dehalococcoidia bacterium]|nr:2-C-methyl-D-erythritol 4-phosphate cytidylyltransferase [Dehalococcoidia bacterium]
MPAQGSVASAFEILLSLAKLIGKAMFRSGKVGAIIVAAGSSVRMGGIDKMFAPLEGKPVLARVVSAFEAAPSVDHIAVVLAEHNLELGRHLASTEHWRKVDAIVPGGALRQSSVEAGLEKLPHCEWCIIHDGARPMVTVDLIEAGLEAAEATGGAIAAVSIIDTIKEEKDGFVAQTLPRGSLRAAQTPQVFRADIINEAYKRMTGEVTDDASLVEVVGHQIRLYPGDYQNIKITTPADLICAEALWRRRGC